MTTHAVPKEAADLALAILADAGRLQIAQGRGATLARLESALAAIQRIRSSGADMQILIRQQINAARKREAIEERARVNRTATPVCEGVGA